MDGACPYCESVELGVNEVGGVLQCRDCGRSSLPGPNPRGMIQATADGSGSTEPQPGGGRAGRLPARRREIRGAPGEVASWPAALLAFAATVFFYLLLFVLPASGFTALFMDRGWVPYVITLISVWALFLLGAKLLRLQRERAVLDRELVAVRADGTLAPNDATAALTALRQSEEAVRRSFLARRIERALRHFESRRHAVEVVEFLASESRADEGRVDASYGLVRVFVWAVPTLGFIGTVIGIGAAVAGFSATLEAASSLDGMKESIGTVTSGLGVAFDTTLLALVMSILIMFPASAVQRIEEAFLGEVDDYCAEHLVPPLRDEEPKNTDEAALTALAERLVSLMQPGEWREG
jgi:biopolymer transport protein ExbB/TolQ